MAKKEKLSMQKKKQDKKKVPFILKDWIKMVIEKSSSKRNKVPKIPATFRFVVVEVQKHKGNQVVEIMKKFASKINIALLGHKDTIKELKLLSIQDNEIEIILSLVPSENNEEHLCEKICNILKNEGIEWSTVYTIKPSSADLNLIYLLRKGV